MSTRNSQVSVVVLTKNESTNIGRCLDALRNAFDDVIVVDDASDDATRDIAAERGARVVHHRFESFACQRNWALGNAGCRHAWVLFLDADEEVTPEFADELETKARSASDATVAFQLCRKTIFQDKWLRFSDGFPVWIMRVVRNGSAEFVDSGHGEVPVPPVDGFVRTIESPILHHAFSKGLQDWIERHNKYSTREAALELDEPRDWRLREVLSPNAATRRRALRCLSRRCPCRPQLRFLYQFIFKLGFLDGATGFRYSVLMAIYEYLIVIKKDELLRSREMVPHEPSAVSTSPQRLPARTA